ncbi:hypothetical protein [Micromonospora sp. DT62]|uniref:hypothetical protein n=1 Tax=Micromonospora sp. DT62 TaxID=3416521 RepID=UPI003CEACEE7
MLKKLVANATMASAVIAGPIGLAADPAAAGTCGSPGCGGVVTNRSSTNHSIKVANCFPYSSPAYYIGDSLPCVKNPDNRYAYNADFQLPVGASTINYSYYYDTDAFRVYGGCSVTYQFEGDGSIYNENRQAYSTSKWLKFSGIARVKILSIYC